ncbi:MAG: dihydroorotate dehydrogenase electron transfer subunit [Muribaculaceae bacterium]
MTKYIKDFILEDNQPLGSLYSLLKLRPADGVMPTMSPGQFVQVEVRNSKTTFLRRPISINFVDESLGLLWLLVRKAGDGTAALIESKKGEIINIVLPLGNGFTIQSGRMLLIGGGVGVAPLLYLGKKLSEIGADVTFLLGARSKADLLELQEFEKFGKVCVSTEDGTMGEKGFVTEHSIMRRNFDLIQCCGPQPMMKAVAKIAKTAGMRCEVSLENVMACGIGACLCCVEDTADSGNVCVCKEGPVFNIERLKW